jgi:hypothetical protein
MLIILPIGGLCNYLRVMFSYYEYALKNNSELTVIWLKTPACNGYFLDYFEPVPNIKIIYNQPENIIINYKGSTRHVDFVPNYTYLKLLPQIKKIINKKINILTNNYISVHIRRTDHIKLAKRHNAYTSDDDFLNFINKYNNKKNVYIATDNEFTYNLFKKYYPKLIKFNYHKTNENDLRQTSLKDAIIDIYMCVFSSDFMGSGTSSFSGVIRILRKNKESIDIKSNI